MQSIIYYGGNEELRTERVMLQHPFANHIVDTVEDPISVKIATIRKVLASLATTSSKSRLVFFPSADNLTPASQNTLLKSLEEPPASTTFILSVGNLDSLLPTIRSRCTLIKVEASTGNVSQESLGLIKAALQETSGARIALASSVGKTKADCLLWIDQLITSLHLTISTTSSPKQLDFLADISELSVKTRIELSSNVNVGLAMQNFFLHLPRLK